MNKCIMMDIIGLDADMKSNITVAHNVIETQVLTVANIDTDISVTNR